MTALIVILIIIAAVAVLLFIPLNLYISYSESKTLVWLRYLFIKYKLYPEKQKKKKKEKKEPAAKRAESEKKPKESFFKKLVKVQGVKGLISILKEALSILKQFLEDFTKHILVRRLTINIVTGGEDAAASAMNFGYVCDAVYPAIGALSGLVTLCRVPEVEVKPDFYSKSSRATLYAHIAVRPAFVIAAVVTKGIKALKLYMRVTASVDNDNANTNTNKQPAK